jgi:four helix bundle protein
MNNKKENFKQQFKQRCYNFSIKIFSITEKLRKKRNNWPIIDQLIRSGTSIGANIVEGGYSYSVKEFLNYFQIAVKSAAETTYWLSLLSDINPEDKKDISILLQECIEIRKLLSTIVLNTKSHSKSKLNS